PSGPVRVSHGLRRALTACARCANRSFRLLIMAARGFPMTNRAMRTRQMLERVRAFGTTHRDLFLPQSGAGRMFAVVADVLESLRRHDVAAMEGRSSERAGGESKAAARIALRRRLSGISRTARVAAFDKPGFDKRFRVRLDCSDE